MPRPSKWRSVCGLPKVSVYGPMGNECSQEDIVLMTVDEYETIRLIDHEGFTQEECSKYMDIARTTVQAIYNKARKKVAVSLVEGKILKIEGGNYKICNGNRPNCCRRNGQCKRGLKNNNNLEDEKER